MPVEAGYPNKERTLAYNLQKMPQNPKIQKTRAHATNTHTHTYRERDLERGEKKCMKREKRGSSPYCS